MSELVKKVQAKAGKWWSFIKKTLALLSVWGLVFSLVTIGGLRAAFDYDDTLVFSTPAFQKAFRSGAQLYTPQFWATVNESYDLERRKLVANAAAWLLKCLGFKITVVAHRPADGGEPLRKEWRRLASRFIFAPRAEDTSRILSDGRYVLYFGDSDSDISEGRKAKVLTLRVKRSAKSSYKEDYNPGNMGEWVVPGSQY